MARRQAHDIDPTPQIHDLLRFFLQEADKLPDGERRKCCTRKEKEYDPRIIDKILGRALRRLDGVEHGSGDTVLANTARLLEIEPADLADEGQSRSGGSDASEKPPAHPFDMGGKRLEKLFQEATQEAVEDLKSKGITPAGR